MDTHKELRQARALWTLLVDPADEVAVSIIAQLGVLEALERLGRLAAAKAPLDEDTIRQAFAPVELPISVVRIEGWVMRLRDANLQMDLDWLNHLGGWVLIPEDPWWPQALNHLDLPPVALWVLGRAQVLEQAAASGSAALVGARAATRYGVCQASGMAYELDQQGCYVISGGAYGIDAAAHRGSLCANGLTLSVQAGGLGNLYPAMNAALFTQILEAGGMIISEQPCSARPAKRMFLTRNRLVAALADVTVVVEAGMRSGAMSTANHAIEQGKTVAAVPGPVTSEMSAGCHELIRDGAALVTSAAEVLELMRPISGVEPVQESPADASFFAGLSPEAARTLDSLPLHSWSSVEQIARQAGLNIETVRKELGLLELSGIALSRQGRFRRAA